MFGENSESLVSTVVTYASPPAGIVIWCGGVLVFFVGVFVFVLVLVLVVLVRVVLLVG